MAEKNEQKQEQQASSQKQRINYADAHDESLKQGYFGRGTEDKDRDAYTLRTGPKSP
jgi:hypothetical protein